MLVAFFFAAGNFSCLHLIARSSRSCCEDWQLIGGHLPCFQGGAAISQGRPAQSSLCLRNKQTIVQECPGLPRAYSVARSTSVLSTVFLPIKTPPIEFGSYPFVRPLWPRTSRLFNLQDLKKPHGWNDH